MANFLRWWIDNPIAANLAMILMVISGVFSYQYWIEKEPFPPNNPLAMTVDVRWPGAGPREIEQQILLRIEESVKNVDGVKRVNADARQGRGNVTIFATSQANEQQFIDQVRANVEAISGFPNAAEPPKISQRIRKQRVLQLALYGDLSKTELADLAHKLGRSVAKLPLISDINLRGEGQNQIDIEVTQASLQRYGITIDEISRAIRNHSLDATGGIIQDASGSLRLSIRNRAEHQQAFESIIVRQTDDGKKVLLRDLATVYDGVREGRYVSRFDGQRAILIEIRANERMDIPKMSASVKAFIEKQQPQLPDGVNLSLWEDWNQPYESRLSTIFSSAATGLALVCLLLLMFLQAKIALWVAIGIATTFAASFTFLPSWDVSLNMISLFAFLMVIGIVVDDALVIGESIHLANEAGLHGAEAAHRGLMEVAKPVIFGVLTTIFFFIPMLFIPGPFASFAHSIAVVVILALCFSMFEALCILPSHLRHLKAQQAKPARGIAKYFQKIPAALQRINNRFYVPTVSALYAHRYTVLACFIGAWLVGQGLIKHGYIAKSHMPEIPSNTIRTNITMPPATSHTRLDAVLQQLETAQNQMIDYAATQGSGELISHQYIQKWDGTVYSEMRLVEPEKRAITLEAAVNKLQTLIGDIPDAEDINIDATLNEQSARISFSFHSDDISALKAGVDDFKQALSGYTDVVMVRDDLDRGNSKELVFSMKPGAETLGLTLRDISNQVRSAYTGSEVQRLARSSGDVRVRVLFSRDERETIDTLDTFMVRTRDGRNIPLLSIVDVDIQAGIQRIRRRDGNITARVFAAYIGDNRGQFYRQVKKDINPDWRKRHPEVGSGAGEARQNEDEFEAFMKVGISLALLACYALMAIAFSSYGQPLLIMSAIPFALLGAWFGHLLHDVSFGLFSQLGIAAAAGVVINDNVVLIDAYNRLRAKQQSRFDAMINACRLRFRPIVLTSTTTFLGLLPMLSADSVQAQFLIPMVVSLAYGVLAATFVTLLFMPCLTWVCHDIGDICSRVGRKTSAFFVYKDQ